MNLEATTWGLAAPLALALLPLPLLARRLLRPAAPAAAGGLPAPQAWREAAVASAASAQAKPPARGRRTMLWAAWIGLVVALAGPRALAPSGALAAAGRDVMFVLDLSGSMVETDYVIDGHAARRIDAVKQVGAALMRRLSGDRVGIVVFADHAFAPAPLSFDVDAVAASLSEMEVGIVGRSTAIGEGLGLALKRLALKTEAGAASPAKIIVLLSDGANDAGVADPFEVARLAHDMGVRIFTLGFGVNDTLDPNGDADPVDFVALQKIAEIAGGEAIRVRDTAALANAADRLTHELAGEVRAPPGAAFEEFWVFPAAFSACAIAAFLAPPGFFPRRSPRAKTV